MVRTADAYHRLRKRLVILGGGTAGALLALQLQTDANVTLVDARGYYRAMLVPGQQTSRPAIQRSGAMLSNVRHIQGKVSGLDEQHVWVERDTACPLHHQIVGYDILVFTRDFILADGRSETSECRYGISAGARHMALLLGGDSAASLAGGGKLAVDGHSQVVGFPRWFAVGGLTETAPNWPSASSANDVDKVARSIKALLSSRKDRRLTAGLFGGQAARLDDG